MGPPKTCAVCGDRALGYNFSAVTCESCKAFFRRNALTNKEFTCPFNQNCDITIVTRRFCQKCRLKKCLDIGMNSENIMSEEDKLIKRRKIETNREAKRKHVKVVKTGDELPEDAAPADSSSWADIDSQQSCTSFDSTSNNTNNNINSHSESNRNSTITSPISTSSPTIHELSGSEIVELLVNDPDRASQTISNLMRNKEEALIALEKVILNSHVDDALRLISHLISYPGDALKIISKLMNSPFNALSVFTKFMSSPTDGLEIISKVVSSPQDVLQFIRNLMDSPENAIDIMTKFMNTPAEALKMLNHILSNTHTNPSDTTPATTNDTTTIDHSTTIMASSSPIENVPVNETNASIIEKSAGTDVNLATVGMESNQSDMQQLMQQIFGDSGGFHYLNSIDSVLTEVIRLEFLNENPNVCADLQIKQEFSLNNGNYPTTSNETQTQSTYNNYNNTAANTSAIYDDKHLNEVEQMKLRELRQACEALYDPIDEEISMLDMGDERIKPQEMHHKFVSLINLTAVAIKRLIKMAKKISAFRNMCQEDQVALLKGGCTEMMIMRSVMTYDGNRNIWKVPHATEGISTIRADLLKIAKCNLYEELLKFNSTFDEKWRSDENIILILCAIVLFTPTRSKIVHKDVIKLEQNSYYYLLRRYLESVYAGCEAKSTLLKLIQKVSDVGRLNQVIIGVYLNVNPSEVEPLIREIFDIKPQYQQY